METVLEQLAKRIAFHLKSAPAPTDKRRGRKPKSMCKEKGCERNVLAKGLCATCYRRARRKQLKS